MPLDLARSKFHFIRKRFIVEHSTIRAFFLRHAADSTMRTAEHSRAAVQASAKPIGRHFRTKPASLDQFELKKNADIRTCQIRMCRLLGADLRGRPFGIGCRRPLCGGQQYGRQTTADFGRLDRELCRHASSLLSRSAKVLPAFFEALRSARSV